MFTFALACSALLPGCGDKSEVSLELSMQNANLTVTDGAFGEALTGGFDLSLALGKEASGASTVSLGSFSLRGANGMAVIDPLPVDAGSTTFPVTLSPGDTKVVNFTLVNVVGPATSRAALCPGPDQILGAVLDNGKSVSVTSSSITPTCN